MIVETKTAEIFTTEIESFGELLLHHQCWFFGRDIHHPKGNLLIRRGFERCGVTEIQTGSNCYRLRVEESLEINLWGWGVFFGDSKTGGIFIKRYDFRPRLFSVGKLIVPVFKSEQLPPNRLPREDFEIKTARHLTVDFIRWILRYEDWVTETCGAQWRRKNLRDWDKSAFPARRIKPNWLELQNKIVEL